jgi:hypothetical protein
MPREPVQVLEEELELLCRQRLVMSLVAHSLTVRATAGGHSEGCFVSLVVIYEASPLVNRRTAASGLVLGVTTAVCPC